MTMDSRWRWGVVAVATVLVVGLLGAAFLLGQPRAGTPSTVMRYAPADTAVMVELRQDLPGDQHNLLAQFMSHFPGFADQAAFDQKFDETLNELFKSVSAHTAKNFDYRYHFKPWFGGQIGLFSSDVNPREGRPSSMIVVFTVKAGQTATLESWLSPDTAGWTQTTYEGSMIWTGQFLGSSGPLSLTWSDEALVISTRIEDLERALDARADRSPGLADDQYFLQQLAPLHADRLGTFYFDGRAFAQQMRDQVGGTLGLPGMDDAMMDSIAIRILGEIRAEGDHLALTTRTERAANSNMPPLPGNRSTNLAELAPNDALFYAELRDFGQSIGWYVEQSLLPLASAQGAPVDLSAIQQLLGVPPQDYFDFVVDAAVSVSGSPAAPVFGVVATVDDEAIAAARVNKLVTLLRSYIQFGGDVTIDEEQHGAATLTVITLGGGLNGATETSVALSVTGGRLVLGTHDFVIGTLDRTRDQSLAARPEFQASLTAGGVSNAGIVFVDVAAAIGAYESIAPAEERAAYDLNQKPFLDPLSHLAMISTTDGGQMVQHLFLYVK